MSLNVEDVSKQLAGLVLYPTKQTGRSVRITGGPYVALYWGREGIEILIEFSPGRASRFRAEVVSTGKSPWLRDQTHRLAPEFLSKMATAIANNPEGRRVPA